MRRGIVIALAVVLASAYWLPADADDGLPIDTGLEFECFGAVPHLPLDPTRGTITAKIAIALDGVTPEQALAVMDRAAQPYAAEASVAPQLTPDVAFEIVAMDDLSAVLEGNTVAGFIVEDEPTGTDLMSQLIRYYRTNRPDLDRDHVHLLTNRDLTEPTVGNAVAGIDNCIGSVGTEFSYSMGEVGTFQPSTLGPFTILSDVDAKIAAHEIGHAFGAHHHYANCVEEVVGSLLEGSLDVCTLMFNDVGFESLHFGAVEVAAIRGFAEAHLAGSNPIPQLPLPPVPVPLV